jgi:hypothetical protein
MTTTALPLLATLKACPFCGGSAWIRNDGDWWSVCHGCKVAIGPCPEQTEAIAAWNRRAPAAEASAAMLLVLQQAEDEGLWCRAETATEAYLQQELRKLHAAIETVALAPAAEAASEAWLRRQADLEDQCASVSAGAPAAAMDEVARLVERLREALTDNKIASFRLWWNEQKLLRDCLAALSRQPQAANEEKKT